MPFYRQHRQGFCFRAIQTRLFCCFFQSILMFVGVGGIQATAGMARANDLDPGGWRWLAGNNVVKYTLSCCQLCVYFSIGDFCALIDHSVTSNYLIIRLLACIVTTYNIHLLSLDNCRNECLDSCPLLLIRTGGVTFQIQYGTFHTTSSLPLTPSPLRRRGRGIYTGEGPASPSVVMVQAEICACGYCSSLHMGLEGDPASANCLLKESLGLGVS